MHGNAWTTDMDQKLRKRFLSGDTASFIGKSFGKTKNSVIGRLHRLGLYRDQSLTNAHGPEEAKAWSSGEDDILRKMCESGQPMRAIATELGRSIAACTKRARRIGIPPRPTHYTTFSPVPWSETEIADAVEMRRGGFAWETICNTLHRHKPAVISKVLSACDGCDPKPKVKTPPRPRKSDFTHSPEPKPPQIVYPISPADLHCETVRNDERAHDGCRWLVNDRSPWLACAAKRMGGESYCTRHMVASSRYPREQAA